MVIRRSPHLSQADWTPELVVELQCLKRMTKMTSVQIAAALGHGLTKGAITGKVFRLKHGHSPSRPDRIRCPSPSRAKWTPELVAKSKRLEQETTLSRAEIAAKLGHGLTAAAVISKAWRLRRNGPDYQPRRGRPPRTPIAQPREYQTPSMPRLKFMEARI